MPGLFKGLKGSFKHHFVRPSTAQGYSASLAFDPDVTFAESETGNENINNFAYIRWFNNFFANSNRSEITVSFWMYPQQLPGETSLGSEEHTIYWVHNPSNNTGQFGRLGMHSSKIDLAHQSISIADSGGANVSFNQWNHVLLSMKRDNTTVTSGHGGGSLDTSTNRDTSNRTTPNDRIHLVVNGVAQHRYVQPNSSGQTDGFFQNDFRTGTAGDALTFGQVTINSSSTDLFTANSSEDLYMGLKPLGNDKGTNGFKGSIFQFYVSTTYYDLTDTNNIALFYNSGSSVSSLPANPVIFFNGGSRISSGSHLATSSQFALNDVTASSLSNP